MKIGDEVKLVNPYWFHRSPEDVFTIISIENRKDCASGIGIKVSPPAWENAHVNSPDNILDSENFKRA